MSSNQKFNIGDLVALKYLEEQSWGIVIRGGGHPLTRWVRWADGSTDWYNTSQLIVIAKAK